ncbi:protein FAR1-RELATED SEQUENCE 5-like [Arachis ipaensis]|uniref:protein FAR1-RELATED SEQUENCE 5-like n=1 Tax=Arachis ipaensis TaxID=130454 RepID=UPI0007AF0D2D|nr:protein FAR1-RELATED SEQUENCE 5-like [Arachis ipaensis]
MEFSTPEGRSNSTMINSNERNEELSVGEVVIQEGSKADEITDVIVMRKDELDLRHEKHEFRQDVEGIKDYRESQVKAATRANRITATRCRARMYVMLDREKEIWVVSRLELRHSHPCSAKKVVHYHEYRKLTMHAKYVITDNDEVGIRPNKTYLALANEVGGSSNLSYSEKDVRNYITSKLRCADDNADFKEMMNYFIQMKEINPNFFYAIDVDDANKFKSALWVDARCRDSYEYYGDVVSFDTTYKRNRHGLPFASFVGVNHHRKSTLLGCALLGSEETPSFEWMFITDQFKAMAGAIRKVLPDTVHQWCIWHIMKKSQFKVGGCTRYGELNAKMNHIVRNSPSTDSFEANWAEFIKEFDLGQNRYLTDIYANQRKWVPIFFKSEFWAGMRSIQRSESMHAFCWGFLHCKSGLVQFVHEYDNVLGNKEQKELEDDVVDAKGVIPCIESTGIERQFQREYTNKQKIVWEKTVYRTFTVYFDPLSQEVRCEYNKFESTGIFCCHTLTVWSYYRVDRVLSCYVLPRLSKNVLRKHTYIKSGHDVAQTNEGHNLFRRFCLEFYNVAQEFVNCDEEATILRSILWDAKSKLTDYHASMHSTIFSATQITMPT